MNRSLIYSCVLGCLVLVLFSSTATGQSAIRVGYIAGWYQSPNFSDLTRSWSEGNTTSNELKGLGFSNGIDLGFTRRKDNLSYNLSYSIALGRSSSAITDSDDLKLNFFHHMVGAGIGTYLDRISLQTTVLYNRFILNGQLEPNDKNALDRINYFSSRIAISYMVSRSGSQRLALEPFVDIPWSRSDHFTDTADFLEVPSSDQASAPLIIGLRVVLLNGSF